MKLILTAAVENLGAPGEIVEVKNGYGEDQLHDPCLSIELVNNCVGQF